MYYEMERVLCNVGSYKKKHINRITNKEPTWITRSAIQKLLFVTVPPNVTKVVHVPDN